MIDWIDHLKNCATIDNVDEKAEKSLEPVSNCQRRDLLRFALRLESAILTIE